MESTQVTDTRYLIEQWIDDTYVVLYHYSDGFFCMNDLRHIPPFKTAAEAEIAARIFDIEDTTRRPRNF